MKIKSLRKCASVIIFLGISPFVFSSAIKSDGEKNLKKSNASSSVGNEFHEIPTITNEADYAEFQKQRELAGRASSSSSQKSNITSSRSNQSMSISK
jgi:hypothetical protein